MRLPATAADPPAPPVAVRATGAPRDDRPGDFDSTAGAAVGDSVTSRAAVTGTSEYTTGDADGYAAVIGISGVLKQATPPRGGATGTAKR